MKRARRHPLVHLELHTGNLARACAFYEQLFSWRPERIDAGPRSYLALELSHLGCRLRPETEDEGCGDVTRSR
jgi:predicted enzyme related to lactoylglutathione lyase